MHRKIISLLAALNLAVAGATGHAADPVNFSTDRSPAEKKYRFETEYHTHTPDGTRVGTEKAIMDCALSIDEHRKQKLVCLKFVLVNSAGEVRGIPRLVGWESAVDAKAAEVLGVTHADFQNLASDDGSPLAPELSYRVYNTFIDFYTFNNVFGQPGADGAGGSIADLTVMGKEIEHHSAYSTPPVDLGDAVKQGSFFKNGRVTLQWLGIGTVEQQSCAIVRFDSGESSFQMLMEPIPNTAMQVKGGSHYWGDLFVNLDDYWMERATFKEFVMTEVVFGKNPATAMIVKRIGTISLIR